MAHNVMINGKPVTCVNEDENFWGKYYLVSFAQCLGWDSAILVNASCDQDAADEAADYAEKQGWMGYFVPMSDIDQEFEEEYCTVGNHCLQVPSRELNIRQVKVH